MRVLVSSHSENVIKPQDYSSRTFRIGRAISLALMRFLILILALLLAIPTVLLPFTTSVPAAVWILLIVASIVLLALQFQVKPVWRGIIYSVVGIVLGSILAILASQYFATTPLIRDEQGKPLPGSIASLEQVELNGSKQWISIRGKDVNDPVLLFLAGGPGGSQLAATRHALAGLEDHFVVVNWEQPGAGKSFNAVDRSTLTPERYITDGLALVSYLRERFDEQKIYVVGESWGSALGIMMAQREPQSFHAFIGTGQMVTFLDADLICYDLAMKLAEERGDTQKVEQLRKQGPPPYYGEGMAMKEIAFIMPLDAQMSKNPDITHAGNTLRDIASPEYGLYDKVNWLRGTVETLNVVYPQLWNVDFRKDITELDVPIYFLVGRHDLNAPPVLAQEYYELLHAPHKEWIWFEHSGHGPWSSESAKFVDVIVNRVLPQTYSVE